MKRTYIIFLEGKEQMLPSEIIEEMNRQYSSPNYGIEIRELQAGMVYHVNFKKIKEKGE